MYTREIQAPVDTPVENGKPVAGTWVRAFKKVDLLDIEHPFAVPIPKWLADFRIKEWQSFMIQNDQVYFEAFVANLKFFRFIAATVFDKKSGEAPLRYFDFFPFSFWRLPSTLLNSAMTCRAPGYFITIQDWLDVDLIKLDVNIESGAGSPAVNAMFEMHADTKTCVPLAVNMLFSPERSLYTYKNFCPARGNIKIGEKADYVLQADSAFGCFRDYKGMLPYITRYSWAHGSCLTRDKRVVGFSLGAGETKGANRDNENALWVSGALTPLPPVRITQSGGIEDDWVIEDVEGMVDLTFTPTGLAGRSGFNIILTRAEFYNPVGVFNGFLMTKDGEKIVLRNCHGYAERLYLRL